MSIELENVMSSIHNRVKSFEKAQAAGVLKSNPPSLNLLLVLYPDNRSQESGSGTFPCAEKCCPTLLYYFYNGSDCMRETMGVDR